MSRKNARFRKKSEQNGRIARDARGEDAGERQSFTGGERRRKAASPGKSLAG